MGNTLPQARLFRIYDDTGRGLVKPVLKELKQIHHQVVISSTVKPEMTKNVTAFQSTLLHGLNESMQLEQVRWDRAPIFMGPCWRDYTRDMNLSAYEFEFAYNLNKWHLAQEKNLKLTEVKLQHLDGKPYNEPKKACIIVDVSQIEPDVIAKRILEKTAQPICNAKAELQFSCFALVCSIGTLLYVIHSFP